MRADALRRRLEEAGELIRWDDDMPESLTGVATDSRKVTRGALFMAYAGSVSDGHGYLAAAREAGAAAALVERRVEAAEIPEAEVKNGRRAAALAAALFHGDPAASLRLVAATGTNGKTTTVHLLRHLLGTAAPAGSLGTLGAIDGGGNVLPGTGSLTTPGPVELQAVLAALRDSGCATVAMETSSHSLDQDRVFGLRFAAAVYTNLTRDHLDYHGSEEKYLAAKLRLSSYLAEGGWEVTNADDPAWQQLAPRPERLTFGMAARADVMATDVEGDQKGMRFTLEARGARVRVSLPLLGMFNVENALGAAATAIALGMGLEEAGERLASAPQVPGRMERLAASPCVVLRDYAHTPDALARALAAVRPLTAGRLITVFGCGGDRDRGKRPLMGQIAAREADLVIVTSDNPRTESPERILDDIETGMADLPHLRIADRRAAIARALSIARAGDTIILAGKGHEAYQVVGKEYLPFDERDVVREAVEALAK